jgi:hypothetical protein
MAKFTLNDGSEVLVDNDIIPKIKEYKWYRGVNGRAYRTYRKNGKNHNMWLHRFVLGIEEQGVLVDHINGDPSDNRRCNLRPCTSQENSRNMKKTRGSSRYKGVCWDNTYEKWMASICVDGKGITIGRFNDEKEAAVAYNEKALELFGDFARLNII